MLNIFAETFRIATRTDEPWLRDSMIRETRRTPPSRENSWFWRGRRWSAPNDPE